MKLSELSTDQAADVLCELVQPAKNIVSDKALVSEVGEVIKVDGEINRYGMYLLICKKISRIMPILLKAHRADVYGVLAAVNLKSAAEIAAQPLMETLAQIKEAVQDEELINFFKSFMPQGQKEQSAPSASSPGSE